MSGYVICDYPDDMEGSYRQGLDSQINQSSSSQELELTLLSSFFSKIVDGNFEQCKSVLDKMTAPQAKNTFLSCSKMKEVFANIVNFERSYFALDFISNKKQHGKWQSIGQDSLHVVVSMEETPLTRNYSKLWRATMAVVKSYYSARKELAMFYDSLASTLLDIPLEPYKITPNLIDSNNHGFCCFDPLKRNLECELKLVQLITRTIHSLNELKMLSSLNTLKEAEKCFKLLCEDRGLPPSDSSGVASQGIGAPTRSTFSALWSSANKQKLTIITYLSGILSFLNAQFGCYFYDNCLSHFAGNSLFSDYDKAFQTKNWIHSAIATFCKTNKVSCWLMFYHHVHFSPEETLPAVELEDFTRLTSLDSKGACLVLSVDASYQPFFKDNSSSILRIVTESWEQVKMGQLYTGMFYNHLVSSTSISLTSLNNRSAFSEANSALVTLMCCRFECNFLMMISLPASFTVTAPTPGSNYVTNVDNIGGVTLKLNSNQSASNNGMSPNFGKTRKVSKFDSTFTNSFISLMQRMKGIPNFIFLN